MRLLDMLTDSFDRQIMSVEADLKQVGASDIANVITNFIATRYKEVDSGDCNKNIFEVEVCVTRKDIEYVT